LNVDKYQSPSGDLLTYTGARVPQVDMTNVRAHVVAIAVLTAGGGQWTWAPAADGARVLAVETIAAKSRWNFMSAVLRSLTDAGHEVTVFTPFPDGDRENYTEVDTSADHRARVDMDLSPLLAAFDRPLRMIDWTHAINRALCDTVHGDRRLLARADRFDVIVAEPLGHHCMSYLAAALRLPLIYAVPSPMASHDQRAFTGHPSHPAVVPHLLARHAVPDTFVRRLVNGVLHAYDLLATECRERYARLADPKPYDSCPTVGPSVVFQNSHYVTESSGPVAANVIHVGGIHLKPAADTVPHVSGPRLIALFVIVFVRGPCAGHIGLHRTLAARSDLLHVRFHRKYVHDAGARRDRVQTSAGACAAERPVEVRRRDGRQTGKRHDRKMVSPT